MYPYAHQIVIVEGACKTALKVSTPDGHSIDGTLEVLNKYKNENDPENKLLIVTAEDEGYLNGFWPEKTEMSKAYATRATGNYLWQVDSDEFYRDIDMKIIMNILSEGVDAISFPMLTFWGGLDYVVDGFYLISENAREYHRLFAWQTNYVYAKHRPPTVLDQNGIDLRSKHWLNAESMEKKGVFLYHYSLLFPQQVKNKIAYYGTPSKEKVAQSGGYHSTIHLWEETSYKKITNPFRVHNVRSYISWLKRFDGEHPNQIYEMVKEIKSGSIESSFRHNTDVENLLNNPFYKMAIPILTFIAKIFSTKSGHWYYGKLRGIVRRLKNVTSSLIMYIG